MSEEDLKEIKSFAQDEFRTCRANPNDDYLAVLRLAKHCLELVEEVQRLKGQHYTDEHLVG